MQVKTIKKIITKKMEDWLSTITDEKLREDVHKNLLVSGGSITSLFLNEKVNDYDIYIQDMDVLIRLANYYCPNIVLDGRKREEYISNHTKDYNSNYVFEDDLSEKMVRYKNLKENQVRLDISSVGERKDTIPDVKYQVAFLSPNAISLTEDVQIVLRFNGSVDEIHKTFDFKHATNYFTFDDGLVTNVEALECILTKTLKYQGSLYPLTTIIRIKKFLKRGWNIGAGEMLKIMFQISELNLSDPLILEEQLIGVDIAYFSKLIDILRDVPQEKITSSYVNTIIDKVFDDYDSDDTYSEE